MDLSLLSPFSTRVLCNAKYLGRLCGFHIFGKVFYEIRSKSHRALCYSLAEGTAWRYDIRFHFGRNNC
jgi:hypothetical protein